MKKETLEEAAERLTYHDTLSWENTLAMESFKLGAKWQQERMYNEEDMIEFSKFMLLGNHEYKSYQEIFNEWFEQFKNK